MSQNSHLKISVGQLVDFVFQKGHLALSFQNQARRLNGIVGHQIVQKGRDQNYQSEITIKHILHLSPLTIEISGRIDGLFTDASLTVLEEIKTLSVLQKEIHFDTIHFFALKDFKEAVPLLYGKSPTHWAQALIYAYIWALQHDLEQIDVQLTYYINETAKEHSFRVNFSFTWLEYFFSYTIEKWLSWAKTVKQWREMRNESLKALSFPFAFRKEQKRMHHAVYEAIEKRKILFVRAPTGTGKTLASLYPALKALSEGKVDKIFYLTAKTVGRAVAHFSVQLMSNNGARIKQLILTAKEKVCYQEFPLCEPDFCKYAENYYDKARTALYEAFTEDEWTREYIDQISLKYEICPFEFSLQLALFADVIICDYNYVFDPRVVLKRFFEEVSEPYCFLVDEAHNLPDRSREMYSGNLTSELLLSPLQFFKNDDSQLKKTIVAFKDKLSQLSASFKQNEILLEKLPEFVIPDIRMILIRLEFWIPKQRAGKMKFVLTQYYFQLYFYLMIHDLKNEDYKVLLLKKDNTFNLKLFCLNASSYLTQCFERSVSSSVFSATLIPMDYFEEMCTIDFDRNEQLNLKSPFKKNMCGGAIYSSVNTEYKFRENSYETITQLIIDITQLKQGNYLIYFPSFDFLNQIMRRINIKGQNIRVIVQERVMSEQDRQKFIDQFSSENSFTLLGFAVLGGIFGEGIDLSGEKLIGTIIIGAGLSFMDLQKNLISAYYRLQHKNGFNYAYRYPGFNKVLQAGGRVIRSENDKGIIILIDQRYPDRQYKQLFPEEWSHFHNFTNHSKLINYVKNFWELHK